MWRWRWRRRLRRLRRRGRGLMCRDRVGLGWRPELAAGIFEALDHIDVLEVIADGYIEADRNRRRSLRHLARQVPVHIHGIGLGMAGVEEVGARRLDKVARLINDIEPEAWSEHLAFVRAGGIEIGHLAAPPRTAASVAGAARNIRIATAVVGSAPLMENIATLIDPPCSTRNEQSWIADILSAGGCGLSARSSQHLCQCDQFRFRSTAFPGGNPARSRRVHRYRRRPVDRVTGCQQAILARRPPP